MPLALPVAALGVILLSITMLWLYYNTRTVLMPLLSTILRGVPVVGAWLDQRNAQMLGAVSDWLRSRVESAIAPLVATVQQIESRIRGFLGAHLVLAQALGASVHWLRWTVIPAVEASLIAFTAAAEQRIGALAQALYASAIHYARALADQVLATAVALTDQAIAISRALHLTALTALLQQARALELQIGQAYSQSIDYAQQLVRQAEAQAASDAAAVAAAAQQGFLDAERYARELLWGADGAVRQLELVIGAEGAAVLSQAQAYAGALALPLAIDLAAIRELECIKQCNPLGQLGQELQLLDLGVLLAILLGAASHPKEGAAALTQILAPGGQQAGAELGALFGR